MPAGFSMNLPRSAFGAPTLKGATLAARQSRFRGVSGLSRAVF
jgi:hypothetical protein